MIASVSSPAISSTGPAIGITNPATRATLAQRGSAVPCRPRHAAVTIMPQAFASWRGCRHPGTATSSVPERIRAARPARSIVPVRKTCRSARCSVTPAAMIAASVVAMASSIARLPDPCPPSAAILAELRCQAPAGTAPLARARRIGTSGLRTPASPANAAQA